MKLLNGEDERAKKERYKINMVVFAVTAAIAMISIIIKSFFLEFSFFEYGAELVTLGVSIIFGMIILILFLRYKQLDERIRAVLSKIGTVLFVAVYLSYIGFVAAMLVDIATREPYTAFSSPYSFAPFVCGCSVIGGICRMFMTKTISKNASGTDYKQYKKRTIKMTIIIAASCFASGIGLGVVSYFLESNVMLSTAILALLLVAPTSFLSCFAILRAKRIYDKEANIPDVDNNQE